MNRDMMVIPANVRIEQALLGQVIALNTDIGAYLDVLTPELFHDPTNRMAFQAMMGMWGRGEILSAQSLEVELRRFVSAQEHGSIPHIVKGIEDKTGFNSLEMYIETLNSLYVRRRIINHSLRLSEMAYDETVALPDVKDYGVKGVMDIVQEGIGGDGQLYTPRQLLNEALALYRQNALTGQYGIGTGFYDLDRIIGGGFLPEQLILVAARPGMGKTTFQFQMLRHMTAVLKKSVLFISLEMSAIGLTTRLIANMTGMTFQQVMSGKYSPSQDQLINQAEIDIEKLPMNLYSGSALDAVSQLPMLLKSIYARNPYDLVMIDYLGLFRAKGTNGKTEETTAIAEAFKACAKQMKVPIVAAVQLSRAVEQRADKHPMLSDLRDSGALEQAADIVLALFRPDYYDPSIPVPTLDVDVLKQRDGATDRATLGWDGSSFRIYNLASQATQGQQSNYPTRP